MTMNFSRSVISKLAQFAVSIILVSGQSAMASLSADLPDAADRLDQLCIFDDSLIELEGDYQVIAIIEISDEDTQEIQFREIPLQFCNDFSGDSDPGMLKTGKVRLLHFAGGEYSGGNVVRVPKINRK